MPKPKDPFFIPSEKESYTKCYRMQSVGESNTIRTSVPSEIVEREAKKKDLTVEQFIKTYNIQWLYNGFDGAWANFIPKEESGKTNNSVPI